MEKHPKTKQKKVHALSQKAKVFREENPIMSALVWAVQHFMNELAYVAEQPLIMGSDFKAYSKISVNNHKYNDTILPSKFKVKEYCPLVFRDLRERFSEIPEDFQASIVDAPLSEEPSSGRSGSLFYRTHDLRLLVKTLSREEVANFHTIFPAYHAHIVQTHGDTLLPQFLGLYRITVAEKDSYLVVMRNIFSAELPLLRIYDLKGSTVDRTANDKELAKERPVLKDNDFSSNGERIVIGPDQKAAFMDKLKRDAEFLHSIKFMDYSLLVGIYQATEGESAEDDLADQPFAVRAADGKNVFCMGIVDVLTKYGAKKIAAHTAKGMKHGPHAAISTVNPEQYMQRFVEFLNSVIE
eukprot:m.55967 g.55967  ORF g.55967 m.55967 type:complete len:354 (-) comp15663_c0_seq1:61-1122(-)